MTGEPPGAGDDAQRSTLDSRFHPSTRSVPGGESDPGARSALDSRSHSGDRSVPGGESDPGARSAFDSQSDPGAYGLRLPGLRGCGELLSRVPAQWTEWHIVLGNGFGAPAELLEQTRARICSAPSGWVDVDRARRTSTINLPKVPTAAEVAQPFLGSTAVVVAHWAGRQSLHAGAFVADDGTAWAILGSRGAGKSSLLAALALRGVPILTDDVLVVADGGLGLAGPRCIDLRAATAAALGAGDSLGVVGTRERWRLRLGEVAPEVRLGGWIQLEWGKPQIANLPLEQRLKALLANAALRAAPTAAPALSQLMELFALPGLSVRRPRHLAQLDETVERLLNHLAEPGSPRAGC